MDTVVQLQLDIQLQQRIYSYTHVFIILYVSVKSLVKQCCNSLQAYIKVERLRTVVPQLHLPKALEKLIMRVD